MKQFPNSNSSTAEGVVQAIGMTVGCIFICSIAYLCLSIEFLHTFAVILIIIFSIPLVIIVPFAIWLPVAAIQDFFERKTRRSALALNNQSSTEHKEIDPLIFIRLQAVSKIKGIIDKHIETLARRRLMLVTVDHYGIADGSAWNKEVQRFVDKVVRPQLSGQEAETVAPQMNAIFQEMIEDRVRLRSDEIEADLDFSENITPTQFEQWCAKTLNAKGWKAITTKASGDQGADVIASKEGLRIVLQCKLYSGTVGNKAVQEAYSAQRHYGTNASAVVTNAEFSSAARKLATTTCVLLLHYGDLTRLDSLLTEKNLNRSVPS